MTLTTTPRSAVSTRSELDHTAATGSDSREFLRALRQIADVIDQRLDASARAIGHLQTERQEPQHKDAEKPERDLPEPE